MFPTRPSLPKQGTPGTFASRLVLIADPKQLNHGVGKGKTPTGRTSTGMLIRRSLMQAELNKFFELQERLERHRRTGGPTQRACELV